jgi:uncharacterized protein (TIGR03437 family)
MDIRFLRVAAALVFAAGVCAGQGGVITTVAGSGQCCNSADGGLAISTYIGASGVTLDAAGNIYIPDSSVGKVRKVNNAGTITTVAGSGNLGYSGDGGPATSASLFPGTGFGGVVVDAAGNLYISDGNNAVVRKVNTAGIITTFAGNGSHGFAGDGGPATSAQLQDPQGLAVDSAGNLYIADNLNNRVRKVNTAGIITTIAGNGNVVASGDGGQAAAAAVPGPTGLTFDAQGNLYISENGTDIRKVDPTGIITTVAGQFKVRGFSGDGGPATAASLRSPIGLATDASGNLYIADSQNGRIRKVDAAGIITTFAGITGNASSPLGDGGPATSAYIPVPLGVAVDAARNVYVSSSGRIRKISAAAGLSASPASLSFSFTTGGSNPAAQSISVTSSGGSPSFTAAASTTSGGNWLSVSPASGTAPATLSVSVNGTGLAAGVYQGAITLTPSGGAAQSFAVTLTVTGANAPAFSSGAVLNALGYQSKLAPGAVFVVFGSGMGPASLTSGSPDYPTTVAGTSITFTPSGGGSAVNARIVYTLSGQVAALLPSSAAPGTYAMRVTYNGISSAPQNVTVVARAFGIATANSAGTGTAQATIGNVNGGLSLTRFTTGSLNFSGYTWTLTPGHPGDTLVLWGTGGGADPANDAGGTSGDQTAAGNFAVLVNGRQITPLYAGASQGFPGLWQINFTLPSDVTPDCFASLQVSAGGELSNLVTVPIAPPGQGYCSDPRLTQSALAQLDAGGTVTLGGAAVSKITVSSGQTTISSEISTANIAMYTAAEWAALNASIKIGACVLNDRTATATAKNPAAPDGYLDMGSRLPLAGPGVATGAALGIATSNPGPIYSLTLANGTVVGGGKYTITGNGGTGAGPFNASVTLPSSFTVANWDSLNSIDRSKPLTLNWTSTGADTVFIIASTSAVVGKDASNTNIIHTAAFTCEVPAAPGSYTIPTSMLWYLLPGSGGLTLEAGNFQTFNVPLVSGGSVDYSAMTGILGYGRSLTVQ